MNAQCSVSQLESALAGRLSAEAETSLQLHLEECAECGAALERMAGGPAWCQEAAALFAADELDASTPTRDEWSEIDFTVEHLEPADEPGVLGRLGGYDVLEIIGRGGMGVVLKGLDRELKRCVAIKVLAPHLAQSSLARKRFAREAQAAAAVVHPHVLAIHQVQAGGRLPFLIMPLVAGESLAERLKAQGTLELREILRVGMQAAAGLAAAHEQGLVHRDVKPANILLEKGVERAVLTDFGLARAADDVTLTRWGIVAGTPQYMSPEQARGEPLDGRSDLFSLGCVLYEMATGVSPFRADSVLATMRRLVDDAPQALASLNPELPPWFIAIVDKLLAKEPARRFGSAREVSELLEGCLAHVQQPTMVPLPPGLPRPARRRAWRHFNIGIKGGLAMISALGIGLLGIFMLSTEPPDIAGQWSGDDWGQVMLKKTKDGELTGTYTDTYGPRPGEIQLKWSRVGRRFNGTWREGDGRFGELSVRLVGEQIRGAWTTDVNSKIQPGTPRLADLTWSKAQGPAGKTGDSGGTTTPTAPTQPAKSPPKASTAAPKRFGNLSTAQRVNLIACSPDGKLIAVANGNPTFVMLGGGKRSVVDDWKPAVEILDAQTGKIVVKLELTSKSEDALLAQTERVPDFEVTALSFSPAGTMLAVGTTVGQVKLFSTRTGELVLALDDKQAKLADKKIPEDLLRFKRAMGSVESLAFSPDGSLLAVCGGSMDDVPLVWENVDRLGRRVTGPGRLKVWEVKTGTLKQDLAGHSHVHAVAFSPEGELLASAGSWQHAHEWGTGVLIWNPKTGQKMRSIMKEANGGTHAVVFSPTKKLLAIGSRIYDKENDTSKTAISLTYALSGITEWQQTISGVATPRAFTADGEYVAVLCGGQSIRIIDKDTGRVQHEIKPALGASGRWNDFVVTRTGNLVIGGNDALLHGLDPRSGAGVVSGSEKGGLVEVWGWEGNWQGGATPK